MSKKRSFPRFFLVFAALAVSFVIVDAERLASPQPPARNMALAEQSSTLPGPLVAPTTVAYFWPGY